jgi:hypothetical protein
MNRNLAGLAALLSLSLSTTTWAAPPQIKDTAPFGVQRGVATEVTITGANLGGHPTLVAPFDIEEAAPVGGQAGGGEAWKLKLNVAPETAVGVYPIRVRTDEGLSNPFLFSVGQLPQVAEKENNNAFEAAQEIPSLAVVEGQAAGNDVDFFRFHGKRGQRIVVDAQCSRIGSGVDPTIRLTTAGRAYVASADDSPGLITDARLTAVLPEDTDYVIEISDSRYQGGARPVYRLVVGAVPMAEEIFPLGGRAGETVGFELRGGTLPGRRVAAATIEPAPGRQVFPPRITNQMLGLAAPGDPVLDVESLFPLEFSDVPEIREPANPAGPPIRAAAPVVFNGRIDPAGDEDRFTLAVTPGQALRIEVSAANLGSALDGVLRVLGPKDNQLATADDTTTPVPGAKVKNRAANSISPDPSLNFTVPSGTTEITLSLRDLESRGGTGFPYRMSVTPVTPTFELVLAQSEVAVPRGGTALVGVTVARKGYKGPIALTVPNPPAGLSVRGGTIADGQTVGVLSLSAADDAGFEVGYVDVVGQGQGPSGPITASASSSIIFAKQGTLPTNTVVQQGLALATTPAPPVYFKAPEAAVEVVHGFGAPIPIKLARAKDAEGVLNISAMPLPPGLAVPAAKIDAKAEEGSVTVNAAVETALGPMTIGLVAKGKVAGADRTLAVPAVHLNVVRPAALELAAPTLEVKAGETVALKGKVVRKGPFKEAVTVKVVGLPAGLKAEPVKVDGDKVEFQVPIVADAKAAAAGTKANVSIAFQINKKDYATPAVPLDVKVLAAK